MHLSESRSMTSRCRTAAAFGGALVDRAGLKGAAIGGARVSPTARQLHRQREASATADDIRALIERCRREVAARFGVRLRDEIVYLGEL